MHGIIFNRFYKFIRETRGFDALYQIQDSSKVGRKFYDASKAHPDAEMQDIIDTSAKILSLQRDALLEEFGLHVFPALLQTYKAFIDPKWTSSLDMLEKVETVMHRSIRTSDPEAQPPNLKITRINATEVTIEYYSERNMLHFGVGLIKGVANHYKEFLNIRINRLGGSSSIIRITKR